MSDHNPLILDTCENILPKSKEFRFEKSWLIHEDFMSRVELAWHSSVSATDSLGIVQSKLKKVKDSLKGWGVNIRGNSIKLKKELVAELEQLEQFEETLVLSPS